MSRLPVPTHSHSARSHSPVPTSVVPKVSERSSSPSFSSNFKQSKGNNLTHTTSMSTVSSLQNNSLSLSDTRKKQSKRDEAIRKKIESELSRKRTISVNQNAQRSKRGLLGKPAPAKGTVAALKPSPALTVPESLTVAEASQLCAAKRTDCVLVVDDEEGLSGIFTAKDLAYRVTAEGLEPHNTPVSQIMTPNPMVTRDTTSATEALQLMVSKHFRHLPVCNEDGNVVGLLDITKVFHEALAKVERSSVASEQLFTAMAGVQSELGETVGSNPQAAAMLAWAGRLREKTALPDLTTVMDSRTQPATVGPKATVKEVAKLMKERRTTAVCVMEPPSVGGVGDHLRIAGIFTSKDVVLRVIAAGLDAGRCSVVRVMTPHPDTAPPTMTIHDGLKQMHNGHYLNLPVVESDGRLVAIVDVLKLTYATLEQMSAVAGDNVNNDNEGPMWGRFFDSLGHDENESNLSGSYRRHADLHSLPSVADMRSPLSDVHPNDSASVIDEADDNASAISGFVRGGKGNGSSFAPVPIDDGTYVFKFHTPSGRTHRFQSRHDNIEHLREIVAGKLANDPFFEVKNAAGESLDSNDFVLSYTDADGDVVLMTSDHDVTDAVNIARTAGTDRVMLFIQGGKGWEDVKGQMKAREIIHAAPLKEEKEVDKVEADPGAPLLETTKPIVVAVEPETVVPNHVQSGLDEVFGIPKDLLLPASIGALAVVIIGVFMVSRWSSNHY